MREIVNAMFYALRGGIAWRLLPASFPPWRTVYRWFARFRDQGPRAANASPIRIQLVRRPDGQTGFPVIARRWVVKRFFGWINRNRRLAKDFEASIASAEAMRPSIILPAS